MPDERASAGEETQSTEQRDGRQVRDGEAATAGGDASADVTTAGGPEAAIAAVDPVGSDPGSVELPEPDARLLAAHDIALSALHEITAPESVGAPADHAVEPDGVVSLRFANTLPGYPGWFWTVSLAVVDGEEPTVLEAELLPGDDALLAPEWVPWSVRLKEYQEQQRQAAAEAKAAAEAAGADEAGGDADDGASFDEFDEAESDFDAEDEGDDFSEDGSSYLHAGDVDGVDIDELDAQADVQTDDSDEDDSDEDGQDGADEDDSDGDRAGEDDSDDDGAGDSDGADERDASAAPTAGDAMDSAAEQRHD